jgi:hypothetical protein
MGAERDVGYWAKCVNRAEGRVCLFLFFEFVYANSNDFRSEGDGVALGNGGCRGDGDRVAGPETDLRRERNQGTYGGKLRGKQKGPLWKQKAV